MKTSLSFENIKAPLGLAFYMLIIGGLIYMRDVRGVSIDKFALVAVVLAFSCVSSYKSLVNQIMFTLPLMYGLPGNFFLLIWIIMILIKRDVSKTGHEPFVFAGIILMAEIIHYPLYEYTVDFKWLMIYIELLLLVALLINDRSIKDVSQPVLSFCIGSCVFLIILFLMYSVDPFLYEQTGTRMGRNLSGADDMILASNPNNVAYFSVLSASCLFVLYYYKQIRPLFFYSLFALSFALGAFSVSRTWALSFVLLFFLMFLFNKGKSKVIFLTFPILAFLLYMFFVNNASLFEAFSGRFIGDDIESAGGRTEIFSNYNNFLLDNPFYLLFGTSVQFYSKASGLFMSTHNGTQQVYVCYGIMGLVFFLYTLYSVVKKRFIKKEYISLVPLIMALFFLQSIQSLDPANGLYPLIPSVFLLSLPKYCKQ